MLKVVVTGGGGQLATAIERLGKASENEYLITSLEQMDICSVESLSEGLKGADIVVNITLFAVLVYEIFGPFLTKVSLLKAGEIKPEGKTSARHEHAKKLAAMKTENASDSE